MHHRTLSWGQPVLRPCVCWDLMPATVLCSSLSRGGCDVDVANACIRMCVKAGGRHTWAHLPRWCAQNRWGWPLTQNEMQASRRQPHEGTPLYVFVSVLETWHVSQDAVQLSIL